MRSIGYCCIDSYCRSTVGIIFFTVAVQLSTVRLLLAIVVLLDNTGVVSAAVVLSSP